MSRLLPLFLLFVLAGCSSFEMGAPPKELQLRKVWIKATTEINDLRAKRLIRMSPYLVGDQLIQGNAYDGILSLDQSTGSQKWKASVENGVEAGAVAINDRLFFGGNDGFFYSLSLATGDVVWSFPTKSETLSGVALHDGIVFFLTGNNVLYALDAATGKQIWLYSRIDTQALSVRGGATPVVAGGVVYTAYSDGFAVALTEKTGQVKWEKPLNKNKKFKDVDSTPVIDGDFLYLSGYDNALYCLRVATGDFVWKFDKGGSTPVTISGGQLFYGTSSGEMVSLDKETGKQKWSYKLASGVATQAATYKGMVVFGESQGSLMFLDLTTGQAKAAFHPGRGVATAPTVDEKNNRIYFVSQESLLFSLESRWVDPRLAITGVN